MSIINLRDKIVIDLDRNAVRGLMKETGWETVNMLLNRIPPRPILFQILAPAVRETNEQE